MLTPSNFHGRLFKYACYLILVFLVLFLPDSATAQSKDSLKVKEYFDSDSSMQSNFNRLSDSLITLHELEKLSLANQIQQNRDELQVIQHLKEKEEKKTAVFRWISILSGGGFTLSLALVMFIKSRAEKVKIVNEQLGKELFEKKGMLYNKALEIIHFNNCINEIEKSLTEIKTFANGSIDKSTLSPVMNKLRIIKARKSEWDNFMKYFNNVHDKFYEKLSEINPDLSVTDKRLLSLIKLNFTNKEIAEILFIAQNSVKVAKYRLKKKLNLSEGDDLYLMLRYIDQEEE